MLECSTKSSDRDKYTTACALKYRPGFHLPVSVNEDLLTIAFNKDDSSQLEIQPMNLTVSASDCAPPALTFALSRETSISMNLCGQVITYDLKSLGPNPQVIIELLKVTKSECASWMIVSAFYRRRGEPRNGMSVMKSLIEEMIAGGIRDGSENLRPALLLLSGCEADLARLAKTRKEPEYVVRRHYAAAQEYLQRVFGKADHLLRNEESKYKYFNGPVLPGSLPHLGARIEVTRELLPQSSPRQIQPLRKLYDDQADELAQLRKLKRQLEDDYSYERDMRRKYQRRLDDLEKECESARKMERYALDQIKREVVTRRKAEERADSEGKMREELIQIFGKRFGSDDIINLSPKKKREADT